MSMIPKVFAGLLFYTTASFAQHEHKGADVAVDTTKKSIPREVHVQLGETHMMIHHHAPAVRGRLIWGGLVPFGEVWVTGAHSATSWEFNHDIVIGNQTIPAGKYALFTIPDKKKWTIILNKNWEQHLTDNYDPKDDLIRIDVKPAGTKRQERLLYHIEQKGLGGEVQISWEKKKVTLPFKLTK